MSQYPVISFNQYSGTDSKDQLFMFAPSAKDLAMWAGIPRKGWKIRMLFQRWITPTRKKQLNDFWEHASGVEGDSVIPVPTAIVVALRKDLVPDQNGFIDLNYDCPLDNLNSNEEKLTHLAKEILPELIDRLDQSSKEEISTLRDEFNSERIPSYTEDAVLEFCFQLVWMEKNPSDFIEKCELSEDDIASLINSMDSMARPAVVIDGQHRLLGACDMPNAENIFLPTVAVSKSDWFSQIFQFVIINQKAKPIEPSILHDIFGSSLTSHEQKNMRLTFKAVDIDIEEDIAASVAGKDPTSPFKGKIKIKLEDEQPGAIKGFITDGTLKTLIQGSGSDPSQRGFRNNEEFFDKYIKFRYNRDEWEDWIDGKWREYWFALWTEVSEHYLSKNWKRHKPEGAKYADIWSEGSNLTKGVGLKVFQSFIMERLIEYSSAANPYIEAANDADDDLKENFLKKADKYLLPDNIDDFRKLVREEVLDKIDVRFFSVNWKKSLDTQTGRTELHGALQHVFKKTKDGQSWSTGLELFRA